MTGSVSDTIRWSTGMDYITGSSYRASTGTYLNLEEDDTMLDKLLGRLMVHTKKVIIPCKYCASHNAFSNSSCIKCGAPLG